MPVKPAKVPSFGARSGGVGSFASAGATSASVMAAGGNAACSLPEASLARPGAVSAARSLWMGHLNLSQPLGSSAARAELAPSESAVRKARMRMWNLIVGHAEDAGLRSGLLKGMRIPGRPRAYGTAAAHSIAFGSCEPTNSFAIPDKPHTQPSSWTSEQSERRSRTHYHREEFGEDSWLHFAPPIPPWGDGSWLSPGRRLSVRL